MSTIIEQAEKAKQAAKELLSIDSRKKNNFLNFLSEAITKNTEAIINENKKDLSSAGNLTMVMRRRLELTEKNIQFLADSVKQIVELDDPVGQTAKSWQLPNGLNIKKVRVPIGVIVCIFESRPNVIIDVTSLCIKSGNAVIVRGGKEAIFTNNKLMSLISESFLEAGLPAYAVQQLEDRSYQAVEELVQLDGLVDLVIPRGRESLIKAVCDKSKVPVIKHTRGMCHAYIDSEADINKAIKIVINAKTSNPATCNSIETLLIHQAIADKIAPKLFQELVNLGVELRCCDKSRHYHSLCLPATEDDWSAEYLDLILAVKIVDSYEEAIEHIQKYSSGLTDSIITENKAKQEHFQKVIDDAVVLINASNRLVDGGVFGLGGEVGISTNRIHMRGPMGLEDLTVTKYVVTGDGQIRE